MKRYEVAVVGCGKIWEIGHWPGLKGMPDEAHVRYAFDTDTERARKAAAETGAQWLADPDQAFSDPAVDIVAITTPPFARVEYVERACAAGKHLMVEKPMARTLEQALRIVHAIRQAGVKCFVPFARAVSAPYREVAELIRGGAFGEPLAYVHANLNTPYGWVPLDHWMHDQKLSGGPVFDYSIHFLELARACLGVEAETVLCAGAALTGRVASDDLATLLVQYQRGRFGQFTKGWAFPPGTRYGHSADHVICREAVVVLGKSIQVQSPEEVRDLEVGKDAPDGRTQSYRNLIAAIEGRAKVYASEIEGLRMTEILAAMECSRNSGRREPVVLNC